MRLAEIKEVVVGEVPLAVARPVEDGYRAVGQGSHDSTFHVTEKFNRSSLGTLREAFFIISRAGCRGGYRAGYRAGYRVGY